MGKGEVEDYSATRRKSFSQGGREKTEEVRLDLVHRC